MTEKRNENQEESPGRFYKTDVFVTWHDTVQKKKNESKRIWLCEMLRDQKSTAIGRCLQFHMLDGVLLGQETFLAN